MAIHMSSDRHNASLPRIVETPSKKTGCTVIAHISDLHFRHTTNLDDRVWRALALDLERFDIDILAVTGDLIDNSVTDNLTSKGVVSALDNVYSYLTDHICRKLNIDATDALIVVPGNHDSRIHGLLKIPIAVHDITISRGEASYELFYERFSKQLQTRISPNLKLCVFTFDSNPTDLGVNFATGRSATLCIGVLPRGLGSRYPQSHVRTIGTEIPSP